MRPTPRSDRYGACLKPTHWGFILSAYWLLFAAIGLEVIGTLLLPAADGFSKLIPSAVVTSSYIGSFYLLSLVVQKLPLAVVYASWAGLGVFSVALLSAIFYQQTLNAPTVAGLFLIVAGVTLVHTFTAS